MISILKLCARFGAFILFFICKELKWIYGIVLCFVEIFRHISDDHELHV